MLAVERSSLFRTLGVCVVGGCLSGCFGSGRTISVLLLLRRCAGGGGVHVMVVLTVEMWYLCSYL